MAATNAKTASKASTSKTASTSSSSHPVLLQFVVGFVLIIIATWFANISDDTGNVAAALFALLWLLWLMNNANKLRSITP